MLLLFIERRGEMLDRADAEAFAGFSQTYTAEMNGKDGQGADPMPVSVVR